LGWSYEYRALVAPLLQAGHRVVVPDLIGFGKSDKPKKESFHTFERHRQILLELVERLDLHNIVLLIRTKKDFLGLSLPLAAPGRYQGLWILKTLPGSDQALLPSDFEDDPQKFGLDRMPALVDADLQATAQEAAAFEAPFPDRGHRAALRAFSALSFDGKSQSVQGAVLFRALSRFWREQWTGQVLSGLDVDLALKQG
jgi:tRNA(adenine34) deaminase